MEACRHQAIQKPQMSSMFLQEWFIYIVLDHNCVIQDLFLIIHAGECLWVVVSVH